MTRTDVVGRSQDLVFAEVDGEAVALSAAQGTCYGLDGIGLRVLQLIDPPTTIGEICQRLTAEYDVDASTCETDTVNLLKELEIEGLVVVERESQPRA
jgi:hypothetical protein